MHRELDLHFHREGVPSLTYSSDNYLRSRFVSLVRQHPGAWVRKDLANAGRTLTEGFYPGEFVQEASCEPNCLTKYGYSPDGSARVRSRLATLLGSGLTLDDRLRFGLQEASDIEGRLIAFLGFSLAVPLLGVGLWRRQLGLALIALVPLFQATVNTFSYYLPSYSSNVILFQLLLISVAASMMRKWRTQA
jgi:hypothetical protein